MAEAEPGDGYVFSMISVLVLSRDPIGFQFLCRMILRLMPRILHSRYHFWKRWSRRMDAFLHAVLQIERFTPTIGRLSADEVSASPVRFRRFVKTVCPRPERSCLCWSSWQLITTICSMDSMTPSQSRSPREEGRRREGGRKEGGRR